MKKREWKKEEMQATRLKELHIIEFYIRNWPHEHMNFMNEV
jgi:hypothetical protein